MIGLPVVSPHMKLATLELVDSVERHTDADRLDVIKISGYQCIVTRDSYAVGDPVVLIHPDTVLPDDEWAKPYKRGERVKAISLRGVWSFGIAVKPDVVLGEGWADLVEIGQDVSALIGVRKYESPVGNDLQAIGGLPFGMFKTDEERYQNLDDLPWGEKVDVTLKVDGSSMTVYCKQVDGELVVGVCSRTQELRTTCDNKYIRCFKEYGIDERVPMLRDLLGFDFALRGELHGKGIQSSKYNPHSQVDHLEFSVYDVLNLETLEIQRKGSEFYFLKVIDEDSTVEVIERDVELTPELIKKYEEMDKGPSGHHFEGVVIKHSKGSFKVINLKYDSLK